MVLWLEQLTFLWHEMQVQILSEAANSLFKILCWFLLQSKNNSAQSICIKKQQDEVKKKKKKPKPTNKIIIVRGDFVSVILIQYLLLSE